MFKRTKKLPPPPSPEFSKVFEDLQTFEVQLASFQKRDFENIKPLALYQENLADFWNIFEKFISNVDDLKKIHSGINGTKLKLQSKKLEIDNLSKDIKYNVEQNLEKINETSKKGE